MTSFIVSYPYPSGSLHSSSVENLQKNRSKVVQIVENDENRRHSIEDDSLFSIEFSKLVGSRSLMRIWIDRYLYQ